MRKILTAMTAAAALAVVAAPAMAQVGREVGERPAIQGRGMMGGVGARAQEPGTLLLERRAELGLSQEQVQRIEAIQARVRQENEPRLEQLSTAMEELGDRDFRAMTVEERQQLRRQVQEHMRQLEPVRRAIRETNRAAGEEIHGLLTAEQQQKLRELRLQRVRELQVRRGDRRPGAWQRSGPYRRGAWQQGPRVRSEDARARGHVPGFAPAEPWAAAQAPGDMLLVRRAELGLTDEQVRQIEAIRSRARQENAPRVARLEEAVEGRPTRAMRDMSPEERQELRRQMQERMQQITPLRQEIRETNRAAGEEIHALLTPEQQETLRSLRQARIDELRQRGLDRRPDAWQQRRGMRPGQRGFMGPWNGPDA